MAPLTLSNEETKLLDAVLECHKLYFCNPVLAQKAGRPDPGTANDEWILLREKISTAAGNPATKTTSANPTPKGYVTNAKTADDVWNSTLQIKYMK